MRRHARAISCSKRGLKNSDEYVRKHVDRLVISEAASGLCSGGGNEQVAWWTGKNARVDGNKRG
ncbi:hypothetical protein AERO9A_230103 [Aeromonas salmonicida]|nr:hypothetical protein AERO9A_230103 [Aeromonas salmonicida]